ncbi:serine/threonine-protein kinase [Myxococcaceae bacterium GXIMD 01537]
MHCELCLSEHPQDVVCSNVPWTQVAPSARPPPPVPTPALASQSSPPGEGCEPVDLTGQTLGHYRLVRAVGSGGMGTVYLAEQTRIGAKVAVKVMHPHLSRDTSLRARFCAEARAVNLVGHPHLVHIFDINEAPGGLHYLVMEYLEGAPLSKMPRPMEPALLVRLLAQACEALDAAHRGGVVHRDLKPDNLFVVQHEGEPPSLKVLDFGVAKARQGVLDREQTVAGLVLGTPAYMPPEQWAGQPVDGRADIYALGVTAYLLATGRLPFARGQVAELVLSHGPVGPVPSHELNPRVPPALSEVLQRAMARYPEERYATALDFKRALLATTAPDAPRPAGTEPRLAPRSNTLTTPLPILPMELTPAVPELAGATPPPSWLARVHRRSGAGEVEVRCTELTRGGLFMCCAEPFPRLFSQLGFSLLLGGEEVECTGEVVRHVDTAQAAAWSMSPGVGLQFINPSARLRELLQQLQPSRPTPPARATSR